MTVFSVFTPGTVGSEPLIGDWSAPARDVVPIRCASSSSTVANGERSRAMPEAVGGRSDEMGAARLPTTGLKALRGQRAARKGCEAAEGDEVADREGRRATSSEAADENARELPRVGHRCLEGYDAQARTDNGCIIRRFQISLALDRTMSLMMPGECESKLPSLSNEHNDEMPPSLLVGSATLKLLVSK